MNKKDFDCFLKALEITEVLVSLFVISPILGTLAGAAIFGYLLMMINNKNREDE